MAKKPAEPAPEPEPVVVDPKTLPGYQEYPKWVHPDGGPDTVVTDAAHEARVMGDVRASKEKT